MKSDTQEVQKCPSRRASMAGGLRSSGVNALGNTEIWIECIPEPTVISRAQHLSHILSFLKFLRRDFGIVPRLKVVMEVGYGTTVDREQADGFNSWRAPTMVAPLVRLPTLGHTVFQSRLNTIHSIPCSVKISRRRICSTWASNAQGKDGPLHAR